MTNFKSIKDVNFFLDSIPKFSEEGVEAADFTLDRFKKFCESIKNPQNRFPSIHVAGSNGKGSTCAIIASIYKQAGYKAGLYISPHLIDVKERFTINRKQIEERELILFFQEFTPLIKSMRLTYFEITTAIAFWWFARKKVDIAIIETGLGGRLDATNVITPLVSVITSVTLDHTDILGETIEAVAREKAGIIMPGIPVVVGNLPLEAFQAVKQVAKQKGSAVESIMQLNPRLRSGTFQINTDYKQKKLRVSFRAPVQAYNIAMAWRVCELLNDNLAVSESDIHRGVKDAGRVENHPARFEKLHPEHRWYFDGAHNAEAARAMKQAVSVVGRADEAVLVLSMMKDKLNKKIAKELLEFKKIVYYTPTTKRGANLNEVVEWLPEVTPFPAGQESIHSLMDELKLELVIFGGSFYFYPTVKNWITLYS